MATEDPGPVLLSQLNAPAWRARERAARLLGERLDVDARGPLETALADGDTAVVGAAAEALVKRQDPAALPALLRTLEGEEGEAEQVAEVLGRNQGSWLVDGCIEILRGEEPSDMRSLAAIALGYPLRASDATDVLEQALHDGDPAVRDAAERSLRLIRGSRE